MHSSSSQSAHEPSSAWARFRWCLATAGLAWILWNQSGPGPKAPMSASMAESTSAPPVRQKIGDINNPDHPQTAHTDAARRLLNGDVPLSPRLRTDILDLRRAFRETLAGEKPLEFEDARFIASWMFNLMLDAAYQDALDLGRDLDPSIALAQVLKTLETEP